MDFLVAGLGNPGEKYASTRHNIGMMVLEQWKNSHGGGAWTQKFKGLFSTIDLNGKKIGLLMPQTYMNLSGESIRPALDFYKLTAKQLIIAHDELDIAYEKLQIKSGGGFAGHNGLKSTGQHLGTPDFLRLRIGIGRSPSQSVESWVLSPFSQDEKIVLDDFIGRATTALECMILEGVAKAQLKFHS